MATCGCNGACACTFQDPADSSTHITGTGVLADPYIISATNPGYIRPAGRMSRLLAAQTGIPNATDTALTFDTEEFDTDNLIALGTSTSKITIQTDGFYILGGCTQLTANGLAVPIYLRLRKNGTSIAAQDGLTVRSSTIPSLAVSSMVQAAVGDFYELIINQAVGGNYNATFSTFWAMRMGARH